MNWTKAMTVEDAEKKQIHTLKLGSKKVCLWHTETRWFAFDLRCPHEGYPLSQGDVNSDCVLTCRWHNWQFNLEDGQPLRGEDRLQTYPLQIRDGWLWIDITPPTEGERKARLIGDMRKVFQKRYYGAMGRVWTKWYYAEGFSPNELLAEIVKWSIPHFERGFTHGLACISEWLAFAEQFDAPIKRLSCYLEASDFLAEETFGEPKFPYPEGKQPFRPREFVAALENEDEATAITMMRGALEAGHSFQQIEPHLLAYVFNHYLGYGHAVIYLTKIPQLIARLGEDVQADILAAYIRYAIAAIRDDVLPEFRQYQKTLKAVETAIRNRRVTERSLAAPEVGASLSQVWQWLIEAVGQHTETEVFHALITAGARNLLHFDETVLTRVPLKPNDTFSWLSLTHALTFAEAAQGLTHRFPNFIAPALVQLAAFIGRVKPAINPDLDEAKWRVEDSDGFKIWAKQRLFEHGETDGIYPAHWLKTLLAIESLDPQMDSQGQTLLWSAMNRYLQAGFHKKLPERTIFQALELVEEPEPASF